MTGLPHVHILDRSEIRSRASRSCPERPMSIASHVPWRAPNSFWPRAILGHIRELASEKRTLLDRMPGREPKPREDGSGQRQRQQQQKKHHLRLTASDLPFDHRPPKPNPVFLWPSPGGGARGGGARGGR